MTKEELVNEAEEYAEGMAKYYESAHGSIPSQFEKYLRKAVEYGYNKANEWHYPSKGEYPKDEKNVLCILGEFENINLEVGYYSQKENERERWRFSEYSTPDDSEDDWGVSAWKEIVLPELKESE